ncbi:hypothetical protein [Nocardia sp. NPDC052566]|uniref:hypothetical protein n=1 Tax=Nocardia sp. NPDC052566 TaxID=3364330 RepID=UPI0037C63751
MSPTRLYSITAGAALAAGLLVTAPHASADPIVGRCSGGTISWNGNGGTVDLGGDITGCAGHGSINSARLRGVSNGQGCNTMTAQNDMYLDWSDGQTSHLVGSYMTPANGYSDNTIPVVDGLGAGQKVRVVAQYNFGDPGTWGFCMGGPNSGTAQVLSAEFLP